jgi:hypothetical protein
MVVLADILQVVTAVVYFGLLSAIYKRSVLYTGITNVLIGISLGYICANNVYVLKDQVLARISGGDYDYIFAIIIGLLYFTAIIPQARVLYRAATVIQIGVGLGLMAQLSMVKTWDWVSVYSIKAFTGITEFTAMVFVLTGISNFLFSRALDTPVSRVSMQIGRVGLLIYCGYFCGTYQSGMISRLLFFTSQVVGGFGWWVPFVIFAFILLDITGIFRRAAPKIEAT